MTVGHKVLSNDEKKTEIRLLKKEARQGGKLVGGGIGSTAAQSDAALRDIKKNKKRKLRVSDDSAPTADAPVRPALLDGAEGQKMKIKKMEMATANGSNAPADSQELAQNDGGKRMKTNKKKKRKQVEITTENRSSPLENSRSAAINGESELLKKKKKKKKHEGEHRQTQGSEQPLLAAVGDMELARSSAPIRKALYSEHAAVSALSNAWVDDWRVQREIVVTGSSLRPVPEFHQAGRHRLIRALLC
jgi:hypothetical protein